MKKKKKKEEEEEEEEEDEKQELEFAEGFRRIKKLKSPDCFDLQSELIYLCTGLQSLVFNENKTWYTYIAKFLKILKRNCVFVLQVICMYILVHKYYNNYFTS